MNENENEGGHWRNSNKDCMLIYSAMLLAR